MQIDHIKGGLTGKILRVNLSTGKISTADTFPYARRFISGRTINSYIMLNEMSPATKWSDEQNLLTFGAGCLLGTIAPAACRVSIDTKNAFFNGKGSANFGGHFGPEMKFAGFDNVIITGKAAKPVYLWIHDGTGELRDAEKVWGKNTYDTEEILQDELRDKGIKVASIGPAGEKLVRGACVVGDLAKVAGGSGVGCVMGDKKLKALVARGSKPVLVADPQGFMAAVDTAYNKISASPRSEKWRKGIMEAYCLPDSPIWDYSAEVARNGQVGYWPMEKRIQLASIDKGVPSFKKNITACFSCPIGCMPFFEIPDGKYKGTSGIGYWINSAMYSNRFDVSDPAASLKFHLLTNQLGLDGDFASTVLSWAFECYEKGIITEKDTGGLALKWGDGEAMVRMTEKLASRSDICDLLAEGSIAASKKIGQGSDAFAIHMKGQDTVDSYRIQKGWGLGCSISPVGGRHLRGAVGSVHHSGPRELPRETTEYKNQPEAVFWQLQAKEIEDMIGLCNMIGTYTGAHALEISDYARLTSTALGVDISEKDIMYLARRGLNLEKAFNTLHTDLGREDDYPPNRYMIEPIKGGKFDGHKCDKDKWGEMLDRYYELQGWDKKTGWQTSACLNELGLREIAEKLQKAGRLIA